MSFGVTVYPRRQMVSSEGLTREDLKHLVHECDLALAAAKGKETWRLPPSEGQPKAVLKNRVVAYSRDWERGEQLATTIDFQEKLYREKRHFQRYFTSTFLIYKDDSEFKVSKAINLSLGGTKIISEKPLPVSRPLEVVLVLGRKARWLQTEVVYSEKAGTETPTFYTGLRFKDLSPEDFSLLQDYFQEIQKENYN
jgi:hypothetical protein